ncbi:DUF6174 domain-containing protein [Marinimicrobium agarilyticum]|uniref:DUF6174 domain-containing protein n=1 Tax=Marinimicrobium agarilyticum TaxID=306546 RepID=UPI0003F648E8|nr:DUF6174 domain-containing protein [Marinimicrobium agarilyticum]
MSYRRTFGALSAALTLMSLSGCGGDGTPTIVLSEEQARLNQNLSRWENADISRYEYEYRRSCYCPDLLKTVVTVQGGEVTEAFYKEDGTYLSDKQLEQLYTTNELFDIVQDAINDRVFSLDVEYDPTLGYPTRIAIDRDEQMVDEEITHYASSLQ